MEALATSEGSGSKHEDPFKAFRISNWTLQVASSTLNVPGTVFPTSATPLWGDAPRDFRFNKSGLVKASSENPTLKVAGFK